MSSKIGTSHLTGSSLVAAITSVCSVGFFLFGYDQGVMSGVVISEYWLAQMGNPSTVMIGTITALYDVGAVIGAVAAAFTSERLGRKWTLIDGALILVVGTVLMGSAFERVQMMIARVITGIGIGYITSVAAVYQSEVSPVAHRGWQVCCQVTTMLLGLMLAYWMNYGLYFHSGGIQWRFPLLFQLVPALYVIIVTAFLPDTPRWLMRHAGPTPEEQARGPAVLAKLRGLPLGDSVVQREKDEIIDAIEIEKQEEGTWLDLFKDNGIAAHKRFYLALGIQFMQQLTGINIVTYYAPTLFKSSLGMTQRMSLYLGCFLQVWYIIASFLTWWMIDRVGRRRLLITTALLMSLILVLEAICVSIDNPSASIAAVFLVFAFEACFTWGWMACVWIYPPEILPLKIRAKGAALAAGADFLGNFLVVEITPPALQNIGFRTYIIFAVFNLVNAVIVWCFYPETAGQTLESIDRLFVASSLSSSEDLAGPGLLQRRAWYTKFQWSVVPKAAAVVDRIKKDQAAGVESPLSEKVDEKRRNGYVDGEASQ